MSKTWLQDPEAKAALDGSITDPQWNWKRPVDFFGVVVDENAIPVQGATVRFVWNDVSEDGTREATSFTDANGLVSLSGKLGYVLSVRVQKDGYYTTRRGNESFNYAEPWDLRFHRPDAQRPIVLLLRKRGTPEPLIYRRMLECSLGRSGEKLCVDLMGQRQSDEFSGTADLCFTMEYGTNVVIGGRPKFDWTIQLIATGGGLLMYEDDYPFLAPESGYQRILAFNKKADDSDWSDGVELCFYFRIRDSKYFGRMKVRISRYVEDPTPGVDILEYYVNPSGSRNLEFNEELDVSEKYYNPKSASRKLASLSGPSAESSPLPSIVGFESDCEI